MSTPTNMAAFGSLRQLAVRSLRQNGLFASRTPQQVMPKRTIVYTETGAILGEPEKVSFGVVMILAMVLPFLYVGATISKSGAAFLEENDIFVPDDDDD